MWVFDDAGKLLLRRRGSEEAVAPDTWCASATAALKPGEGPRDAVARVLRQELGLEVNRADDVDQGTFAVPALLEDPAGWQIAVLGGEAGPLFSTWLRGLLEHVTALPQVNHVYQALAAARLELKHHPSLTQPHRAEIMRQVMAHALASPEAIDGAALAAELAARQPG